ncbi:hypothetical protein HN51_045552 [Arachis hypogaea]
MQQNLSKICVLGYVQSFAAETLRKLSTVSQCQWQYSRHFLYSSPAQPLGPEDLVWRMMPRKVVKLHSRRSQRVVQGFRNVCTCDCKPGNVTNTIPIVS